MPMSPGGRFGWEEATKVMVSVSCGHTQDDGPHTRNHPNNAEAMRNVGGNTHCYVRLPPGKEIFNCWWKHIG